MNTSGDMPRGRYTRRRRTSQQVLADERAAQLARFLGRGLKDARLSRRWSQQRASSEAGLAQSTWSKLERGGAASVSLRVWMRASHAAGVDLRAYLEGASAAEPPRDAAHLRTQELLLRTMAKGGWSATPEAAVGSTAGDVVGRRRAEVALAEVWDWLDDVGAAFRSWDRKLERLAAAQPGRSVSGCWVLRATRRNRQLLAEHRHVFRSRFPGSGAAWGAALEDPARQMPPDAGLLWVTVRGDRIYPARP